MSKPLSSCCEKPAKLDMTASNGAMFCTHCGQTCEVSKRTKPFKGYTTISAVRKPTGEHSAFLEVWKRCKGKSEVSGVDLLPLDHPMWHWQFSHLLPKGSYQGERVDLINIVACTIDEHVKEWPRVKEKTDAQMIAMGMSKWIVKVTLFRALRLKSNMNLKAKLSGKA